MEITPNNKTMPQKDAYVIVPLYGVSISDTSDLPISCGAWQLIDKKYFQKNYADKVMSVAERLDEDIGYILDGTEHKRPRAKYTLIKKIKIIDDYKTYTAEEIESGNGYTENIENINIKNQEILEVNLLIMALRLINKGGVQINGIYISSKDSGHWSKSETFTLFDNINSNNGKYGLLDKNFLQQAIDLLPKVKKANEGLYIPLHYFNKYFASVDLFDKIINLSIIWEATILNGMNNELRNALWIRGTYLLGSKHGAILKLAYDIRSKIVHTGIITDEGLKKIKKEIKKITGYELPETELIFIIIKNFLEPITIEIIKYFLDEINKNENQSIEKITRELEIKMIEKLGNSSSCRLNVVDKDV